MRRYVLMAIRIVLNPTASHCIETIAKREYWRNVNDYLKKKVENKRLEEIIELLRSFLVTADFAKLRAESEAHILNGKQVQFVISMKNNKLLYEMTINKNEE